MERWLMFTVQSLDQEGLSMLEIVPSRRESLSKLILKSWFFIFFFICCAPDSLGAADLNNRTFTVITGHGVNNGSDRTLFNDSVDRGIACGPGPGRGSPDACDSGFFGNTSDPFATNTNCGLNAPCMPFSPQLSSGFNLVDNQFGKNAPCGPNDTPPFPYPCNTPGSISEQVPFGFNSNSVTMSPPTLGIPGQPFYTYNSVMSGTNRTHHTEYGFDLTLPGFDDTRIQIQRMFFVIDSTTDSSGQLVGNATGTFKMIINDGYLSQCNVTSADKGSSGTFTAGSTGVITCLNRDGSACPSTRFIPNLFTTPGGGVPFANCTSVR